MSFEDFLFDQARPSWANASRQPIFAKVVGRVGIEPTTN